MIEYLTQEEFEKFCDSKGWSVAKMTVNGKFLNYTDSDVDNMWIGFCLARKIIEDKSALEVEVPTIRTGISDGLLALNTMKEKLKPFEDRVTNNGAYHVRTLVDIEFQADNLGYVMVPADTVLEYVQCQYVTSLPAHQLVVKDIAGRLMSIYA